MTTQPTLAAPAKAASVPVSPFSPGELIAGKFRVERMLGYGGMGVVLEATHLSLDERVALKFLRRKAASDTNLVARFAAEARAAAKLRSEHVARVFDVEVHGGLPFMVMELLEGTDLGTVLSEGPLPMTVALDYIIQAIEGVSEAHAAGIVHRDLKPENLFLAKQRSGLTRLKVLDFGISKAGLVDTAAVIASHETTSLLGSPYYMSPEQLRSSKTVDHRADVWSLGVVLFEMLTACHPFDQSMRSTLTELVARVLEQPPTRLSELEPDLPEELERVIDACLSKDLEGRIQTAAELGIRLLPLANARSVAIVERALAVTKASPLASLVTAFPMPAASESDGPSLAGPAPRASSPAPADNRRRPARGYPSSAPTLDPPAIVSESPADGAAELVAPQPQPSTASQPATRRAWLLWTAAGIAALAAVVWFVMPWGPETSSSSSSEEAPASSAAAPPVGSPEPMATVGPASPTAPASAAQTTTSQDASASQATSASAPPARTVRGQLPSATPKTTAPPIGIRLSR